MSVQMTICDQCGREFGWPGTTVGEGIYCCEACAIGGVCTCPPAGRPETVAVADATGTTIVSGPGEDVVIVE